MSPKPMAIRENPELSNALRMLLEREVAAGETPSAAWRVVVSREVISRGAVGHAVVEPELVEATTETIYDLASLTKPLVTTTLALIASVEGVIDLDGRVVESVPELGKSDFLSDCTWSDLLLHRSGLEAWYPLYTEGRSREEYLVTLLNRPKAYDPRSGVIYSDLGLVLFFIALERAWGQDFEFLAKTRIIERLGLRSCGFRPSIEQLPRIAATERGNLKEREMLEARGLTFGDWREGVIRGEVNDGNAFYLGGVSGHAGLFGNAECVAMLAAEYLDGGHLLSEKQIRRATSCGAEANGERRGLGWQLRTDAGTGGPLSGSAFGHTGFTGTSVWADPERDLVVVLLTNRIHPRVKESRIQEIRRRVNETVIRYL